MLKYLILSIIMILEINLYAQKKLTYEGPYQNGIPAKSTARYSYYLDRKGMKIKDGNFRYLVKEKEHDYRFTQNFQGNYSHGLKDGEWEYTTKTKDYGRDNAGYVTSSEITLSASYIKGYPEGEWVYSALIYKRKKKADGDWGEKILVKDVKILLNFKGGVLVDSIQIRDNKGVTIDVLCDGSGFLDGNFVIKSPKFSYSNQYLDGFLRIENNVESAEYAHYQSYKTMNERDFVVDTLSLFHNKSCLVTKYLNDNIFNKDYFLFNYIEGDKILKRNSRGFVLGTSYKGLYYKQLKVALTDEDKKIIKDIWYYHNAVVSMERVAKMALKKDPKNQVLKGRVEAANLYLKEIKSYICISNQCKKYVVFAELEKASKACGTKQGYYEGFTSKKELLQSLLKASRAAYLKADKLTK